jgi:hypothetical protein
MFLRKVGWLFNELHGVISQSSTSEELHTKFEVKSLLFIFRMRSRVSKHIKKHPAEIDRH